MRSPLLLVLCLVLFIVGCVPTVKYIPGKNISDLKGTQFHPGENTLPSGRKIVIKDMTKTTFDSGDPPALVLNYSTSVSVDNMTELRGEADEVWSIFRKDVENQNLTTGALRPTNGSRGYGFVFMKRPDDSWYCLDDEKNKPK
jgi:hypothetical protein